MTFNSILEKFDSNLWGLHFKIPEKVYSELKTQKVKRWLCTLNNEVTIRSAIMSAFESHFILINSNLQKKLNIDLGDKVDISLSPDHSKYGMEMPEELIEMFNQEPLAQEIFEILTDGKKRNLIYIVSQVKNSQSRVNKAIAICEHLKESKGNLDFKRLNELIKYHNRKF